MLLKVLGTAAKGCKPSGAILAGHYNLRLLQIKRYYTPNLLFDVLG